MRFCSAKRENGAVSHTILSYISYYNSRARARESEGVFTRMDDDVKKKPNTTDKKAKLVKPKKWRRTGRVSESDERLSFDMQPGGPFIQWSRYNSAFAPASYIPEGSYTSYPLDINNVKELRKYQRKLESYIGRLQRRTARASHVKRRGAQWLTVNRTAWMMMHDNAGKYSWWDVYRQVRVVRDQKARRRLQTAFSVARKRHRAEYPVCHACRRFEKTIPERRRCKAS